MLSKLNQSSSDSTDIDYRTLGYASAPVKPIIVNNQSPINGGVDVAPNDKKITLLNYDRQSSVNMSFAPASADDEQSSFIVATVPAASFAVPPQQSTYAPPTTHISTVNTDDTDSDNHATTHHLNKEYSTSAMDADNDDDSESDDDDNDADNDADDVEKVSKSKMMGGLLCVIVVVSDWVFQSEILGSFEQPFFGRYIVNCGYMLAFIPWFIISRIYPQSQFTALHADAQQSPMHPEHPERNKKLFWRLMKPAVPVALTSMTCGYCWYLSLEETEPAVNATIYQSQIVFVYILSVLFLKSKASLQKTTAVLLSLGGVAMVSFASKDDKSDSGKEENTYFGLIFCMVSMVAYATFEVASKWVSTHYYSEKRAIQDTLLFTGCIGIGSAISIWPFVIVWNYVGWEDFTNPSLSYWALIAGVTGLEIIFISAFMIGQTLTSALIMASAQLLCIPASFTADILVRGTHVAPLGIVGSLMIIFGFVLMEVPICSPLKRRVVPLISKYCFNYPQLSRRHNKRPSRDKMQRLPTDDDDIDDDDFSGNDADNDDSLNAHNNESSHFKSTTADDAKSENENNSD